MDDYLQHSRKGTTWHKRMPDYYKRQGKRYYYAYEAAQKKAWKLKKKAEKSQQKSENDPNSIGNRHKRQAHEDIAASYRDVADIQSSLGAHDAARKTLTKANEHERRANDIKPKKTKPNKFLNGLSDTYNRAKMNLYKPLRSVSKETVNKGKALLNKLLKRK
jgi:hypothetical protein